MLLTITILALLTIGRAANSSLHGFMNTKETIKENAPMNMIEKFNESRGGGFQHAHDIRAMFLDTLRKYHGHQRTEVTIIIPFHIKFKCVLNVTNTIILNMSFQFC